MKTIPFHQILQCSAAFILLSCGEESRRETPRKEAALQVSLPEAKVVPSPNQTLPPPEAKNLPEEVKHLAKKVSACRARGDTIGGLMEMHNLMKQWSPVGITKEQLVESLGEPTSKSDKAIVYRFDHGEGGWQWMFDIESGVISKVHATGLE